MPYQGDGRIARPSSRFYSKGKEQEKKQEKNKEF
jgi:hypothetical protein